MVIEDFPVVDIGATAFANTDVVSVVFPDSVEIIGDSCFYSCKSLQNVVLSKNLTNIPSDMFWYCTA